jgi:predicted permease
MRARWNQLWQRLKLLRKRRQIDQDLNDELAFHLAKRTQQNREAGLAADEAHYAARRQFGNATWVKERTREMWTFSLLETLWQDLRYGARMLRKSQGFTSVAVLTLALGIGANSAIFSIMDALLVRELPVRQPEQLVEISAIDRAGESVEMSLPMFEEFARHQKVFTGMTAWWGDAVVNVEVNGALSRNDIWAVDGNFYSELGVSPLLGRLIEPADVNLHSGAPAHVAVLGYGFWKRQLGGDPAAIGKTLRIEGVPFTIVGVTREEFSGMSADDPPEVTLPLTAEPLIYGHDLARLYDRKSLWLDVTGRMRDGVTLQQAQAELVSLWPGVRDATIPAEYGPDQRQEFLSFGLRVKSAATGFSSVRARFAKPLYILMGISALVLLIACVNLATLLLSRSAARTHEMGVRVSLGATRWRLARQLLTESLLLSTVGAALGFVLAYWCSGALADFILAQIYIVPARLNLSPDPRVIAFTVGIALTTGLLFGLAPAWNPAGPGPAIPLQQTLRVLGSTGNAGKALVCVQVALSLILLMNAGLFVRSLGKLRAHDPGFRTTDVLWAGLFPKTGGYKDLDNAVYYRQMVERIAALPGVRSAGISHTVPAMNLEWKVSVVPDGSTGGARADTSGFDADLEMVSPRLFATLGMNLVRGRDFAWSDDEHAPRVAIISNDLAERLFPAGEPIGRHVSVGADPKLQNLQVVGVVSNASFWNVRVLNSPEVYLPALQGYIRWSELLVRTNGDPHALASGVAQAVESMGREYVPSARPLAEYVDRSLLQERVTAIFSKFFGALAVALASIGLYGLMSYLVTRRTQEIGVRLALGARPQDVRLMVLREALALLFAGLLVGAPCALAATRLVASQLFGLSPRDLPTLAAVALAPLVVGVVAGYIPARRAMRVDPMVALRHE